MPCPHPCLCWSLLLASMLSQTLYLMAVHLHNKKSGNVTVCSARAPLVGAGFSGQPIIVAINNAYVTCMRVSPGWKLDERYCQVLVVAGQSETDQ
jgi:hypothetical protein